MDRQRVALGKSVPLSSLSPFLPHHDHDVRACGRQRSHSEGDSCFICTHTTVFDSKASLYYAVASTKPYNKLLSTALRADVERMIAENGGGGGACCDAGAAPGRTGAVHRND